MTWLHWALPPTRLQACYVPGDRSSGRSLLVVLNSATKLGLRLSQAEVSAGRLRGIRSLLAVCACRHCV